jgi:Type IV secretion system pilin
MFLYFIKGGHSDEAQESGKSLMTYAIAGFVIILSFWGIINLISGGIGLNNDDGIDTPDATPGSVPAGGIEV